MAIVGHINLPISYHEHWFRGKQVQRLAFSIYLLSSIDKIEGASRLLRKSQGKHRRNDDCSGAKP
jgi:hypothetical protein